MTNSIVAKEMKEALEAHRTLSEVTNYKTTHTYWEMRKAAEWLKAAGDSMTFLKEFVILY